ncbi:MAG: fibrobacter succinogenes major paralogous domain-containing protein [Bacteroidota bacterium]
MKIKLLWLGVLFIACSVSQLALSQDIIRMRSGIEIKAKVADIDLDVIRYKRFDNLDGPNYTLQKSEVSSITYANGSHDVFDNLPKKGSETFTDARDGKTYKTITIGAQTWMAENLAYKTDKGCWAYDDNETNVAKYGYLYNWETAKTVCPAGWHLPSETDFKTLFIFLDGKEVAADKLKSSTGWVIRTETDPLTAKQIALNAKRCIVLNGNGNNLSGFSALPGGWRGGAKAYSKIGVNGYWWSSTQDSDYNASQTAWSLTLYSRYNFTDFTCLALWSFGYSVRCIKD